MRRNTKYEEIHKIIDGILYKQCRDCKEWFIADNTNFNYVTKSKDGLNERCKVCQKIFNQETYNKNKEERKRKQTEYYWNNKESDNERSKQRYYSNLEYYTEKSRRLRSSPDCKYPEKEAEWRRNNPDKLKKYNERYSNKKHTISEKEWKSCKDYFSNKNGQHVCAYCGILEIEHKERYNQQLHKEHVDCNGEGSLSNCVPSCRRCNDSKRQSDMEEWYRKQSFFKEERLEKIYQWINEDYKLYEVINKKKRNYTYRNKINIKSL